MSETTTTPADTHPEDNGGQAGKTFTQEEVNRIVSDRLARERAKAEPTADEREQALKAREARLDCREYLSNKKYPETLLEVLDTSDAKRFQTAVETLVTKLPGVLGQSDNAPKPTGQKVSFPARIDGHNLAGDQFAEAFKPKSNI